MVFQNYALYPHKTVEQNMGYGLQLGTDLTDEEIEKRVREVAEMMGIDDLLDKKPGSLSGGQQQRVATGRAIVQEPAVFLFDEPLSNLDAKLRKHMRTELARLHTELDITTIYVTHDQEEAMTMADRIVILNDGSLQQVGTPKEVYYYPANEFVADFIGSPSMNFFDVEFHRNGDGSGVLQVDDVFTYGVSETLVSTLDAPASERYRLGVRPENVRIDTSAPADKTIEATVEVVEVVGSDNFIYVDVGEREARLRTSSEIEPETGDVIDLTFSEDDLHLFDTTTGRAVLHGHSKATVETDAESAQART
jgi:multiple sugar transport system ATP-binding protein